MIETNRVYNENCLQTMKNMPDDFIDLTVTSPPYDNLRDYHSYTFDFESIAKELYRVTKQGGTVVWIVNDATINGSETGTSFKQALYFKECGFNLHDTMIWNKTSATNVGAFKIRYGSIFDFMFILTKGTIKTFNPIQDKKNKGFGDKMHGTIRQKDGTTISKWVADKNRSIREYGIRYNIWNIPGENSSIERCHPAQFTKQLANDHIISWSNKNDLIYDPFMGGGTTAVCCKQLDRKWIGSEISKEYYNIIERRLFNTHMQFNLL